MTALTSQGYLTTYLCELTNNVLPDPNDDSSDESDESDESDDESEWSVAVGFVKCNGSYASGFIETTKREQELYRSIEADVQSHVLPLLLQLIVAPDTPAVIVSTALATAACFPHVRAVADAVLSAVDRYPTAEMGTATEAAQCTLSALLLAAIRLGGCSPSIDWVSIQSTLFELRRRSISTKSASELRREIALNDACATVGGLNLMSLVASLGVLAFTDVPIDDETVQFLTDSTKIGSIRWDMANAAVSTRESAANKALFETAFAASVEKAVMKPWGSDGMIMNTLEKHRGRIAQTATKGLVASLIKQAPLCAQVRR